MVVIAVVVEVVHILVLVPLLTQAPPEMLIATVRTTLLPMIVTNSCGLILFLYVMREQGLAGPDD
jgi:LytS/YehU family sensor histidine kinase